MKKSRCISIEAAKLAALLAQEIGLPAGNMWEPAIARNMAREYRRCYDWSQVENWYRMTLGLPGGENYWKGR